MKLPIPKIHFPLPARSDVDIDNTYLIDIPNRCPHCGIIGVPAVIDGITDNTLSHVSFILQCPNCAEFYYTDYAVHDLDDDEKDLDALDADHLRFKSIYPSLSVQSLPDEIFDLYPEFAEIYLQAESAERAQLDKITGMAYRKALEHLVKKFVSAKYPEAAPAIAKEKLVASIRRIEYPMIQNLANASRCIGNDETHTQKHTEYDVADMKRFIIALCYLIAAEHAAEQSLEVLQKK